MTDARTAALKKHVDVAEYHFTRLHQIGVRSVHGLPGDYNLVALDYLPGAGLKWVGNVNELNAGEWTGKHGVRTLLTKSRLRCGWICQSQGYFGHDHHLRCR